MAVFVHLCRAADLKRIRRSGLKVQRWRRGVYAMPAIPDFYASHQWLREIRRWRQGGIVAVYLRIPGTTPALYGHFNGPHAAGMADEAVAAMLQGKDHAQGFETIILADVPPRAIIRVAPLRPVTGWRYFPTAKGRAPCGCPACQARGEPFSRRFKDRFAAEQG